MTIATLKNKRVLVTGGANGIGEAIVQLFGTEGASVCTLDLAPREVPSLNVRALRGDVSRESEAVQAIEAAVAHMGGLDVLVNCAGVVDSFKPTLEQDVESWQRIVGVNLTGTYLMSKAAGVHMVRQRSGSIVNIGSIVGQAGFPRRNAYGASKAGVTNLTRSLACEWGPHGVRVNCIAPGYILTKMALRVIDAGHIDASRIEGRTPLGRWGRPEEIAQAAAFLSSDGAAYITGTTLCVDGGWNAFGGAGDVQSA